MSQAGRDPDLLEESLGSEGGGQLRAQHLERDQAAERLLARLIDLALRAPAELAQQREVAEARARTRVALGVTVRRRGGDGRRDGGRDVDL